MQERAPDPSELPTRRQETLLRQLRATEAEQEQLRRRKSTIVKELERIYPEARDQYKPAPKEKGTVITIFNYEREYHSAHILLTAKGKTALETIKPTLSDFDYTVLALISTKPDGVNATKLLAVDLIKNEPRVKSKINKLDDYGYINIEYAVVI
jgi:hypothetical protein